MIKKSVIAAAAAVAVMSVTAFADPYETITVDKNTINIVVDGERVVSDNFLFNDTTYVPLRRIAEMLGKKVEYVADGNKALITDTDIPETPGNSASALDEAANSKISVERNTMNIFVNGNKVEADNFLYNDTTYVPLRIVSEMFEKTVGWEQLTNTASIGKKASSVFDGNVLGTVNGRNYTDTVFEGYKNLYNASGSVPQDSDLNEIVLNQIKYDCAIMDTALKNGITAGVSFENDYMQNLEAYKAQNGGTDGFGQLLEENGYTYEMYHYTQMMNNLYNQLMVLPEFAPTDEEIQKFYDDNLEKVFVFNGVRAKHVLIIPDADENGNSTDEQWNKALETANKVCELAKNGANFDDLMAEYNMDPGVQKNPNGYTFGRGEMVSEFEDACYSMDVGDISEPIKTAYGYHVIELEEKLPYYKFDDDVKAFIKNTLSAENLAKYLDNAAESSVVEEK